MRVKDALWGGWVALGVLVVGGAAFSVMDSLNQPRSLHWEPGYEQALVRAKAARKPVLIDFWATWCGPCKKMERQTFRDPEALGLADRFVCVKVDIDQREDLVHKYRLRGVPHITFLAPDGEVLQAVEGFSPAEKFLPILREVLETAPKSGKSL